MNLHFHANVCPDSTSETAELFVTKHSVAIFKVMVTVNAYSQNRIIFAYILPTDSFATKFM